jgi:8-amino-7-oxononanoate synthase
MVFTTGYQANLGVLSTLVGRGDHLILDADSHASIYDGARLGHAEVIRFRHNDPEDLYKRLRRMKDVPGERLIVVEGIYSMIGDIAPLKEIAAVKRELGGYLLVDEAHSMGVLGEHGRGLAELAGVEDDVDFVVGTFSKSLGAIGGFCVSDMDDFDVMRVTCRPYMFTASLPPSVVSSTVTALRRLEEQPELRHKLMANARRLYDGLSGHGLHDRPDLQPDRGDHHARHRTRDRHVERPAAERRLPEPGPAAGHAGQPSAAAHQRQRRPHRAADRPGAGRVRRDRRGHGPDRSAAEARLGLGRTRIAEIGKA